MHLLYNLTIKYGIFKQASHTEQVIHGHCSNDMLELCAVLHECML